MGSTRPLRADHHRFRSRLQGPSVDSKAKWLPQININDLVGPRRYRPRQHSPAQRCAPFLEGTNDTAERRMRRPSSDIHRQPPDRGLEPLNGRLPRAYAQTRIGATGRSIREGPAWRLRLYRPVRAEERSDLADRKRDPL